MTNSKKKRFKKEKPKTNKSKTNKSKTNKPKTNKPKTNKPKTNKQKGGKNILSDKKFIKIIPEGHSAESVFRESGIGQPPKINCVIL